MQFNPKILSDYKQNGFTEGKITTAVSSKQWLKTVSKV